MCDADSIRILVPNYKTWSSISSSYKKDLQPLIIRNDFHFIYTDYSHICNSKGEDNQFKMLVVPVYSKDYYDKTEEILRIGKKNFVKYYHLFESQNQEAIQSALSTEFSTSSVETISSYAKNLFSTHRNAEALRNIVDSSKIDAALRDEAEKILMEI